MLRSRSVLPVVSLMLIFSLLFGACTPVAPAPAAPAPAPVSDAAPAEAPVADMSGCPVAPLDPPEAVTVAYVPIMKFAAMYVAAGRGLFEACGLDVTIERVGSGTEAIAFLSEGKVDVGGIAIVTSLWNGWSQGLDIRVIAPGGLEPFVGSPTKIVARKALVDDGTITDMASLKGRIVASAGGPGSGGEYLLAKALERGNLTIRDVEMVQLGNADMPAAFENGSIDAGTLGSPYADQVIDGGFGVAIAEDLTPGLMTVAFVGSGNFVTNRGPVAERFVLALVQAARLMQGDDYLADENIAAYLGYVNSDEETLRTSQPVVYDPDMAIPVDGLADVERIHRENGRTEYTDPIDLTNVVDTSFVDNAIAVLGPYAK
ncbi:MAG: ABC transporter substrate-binding protein [Caldilineaceae bacterium]|nr:ABC transporter substrate-binding protein [Caldilineaceae bacterium]MBP8106185.1 ABC transporter substrate-binding protein [Caldilineaceae bacterium]MBP8125668.1 ABC transporter substrate-binding protein [Caldilineaceae bacterium]MBP9075127.1 ABC transporter substrate-binding protein [Caldilineaceae bacterium]